MLYLLHTIQYLAHVSMDLTFLRIHGLRHFLQGVILGGKFVSVVAIITANPLMPPSSRLSLRHLPHTLTDSLLTSTLPAHTTRMLTWTLEERVDCQCLGTCCWLLWCERGLIVNRTDVLVGDRGVQDVVFFVGLVLSVFRSGKLAISEATFLSSRCKCPFNRIVLTFQLRR